MSTGGSRRRLLAAGLAGCGLALAGGRRAQARQTQARQPQARQTVTLVVGAAAGSGADQHARAFVPFLERHLPHANLTVENLPGEAGLAALRRLADAQGDGSVLGWVATPALPARAVDTVGAGALLKRLVLVGAMQQEPLVFTAAPPDAPASIGAVLRRTVADGAARALGTPPAGSPAHLTALQLQAQAGMRLNIVAFPSAAAARQAALDGTLGAAVLGLGDVLAALRVDELAGFALAAPGQDMAEPGGMPPVVHAPGLALSAAVHRGLAVPASAGAALVERLQAALRAVVADPECHDQAAADGFLPRYLDGPDWRALASGQRAALARLWLATPWRGTGIG
ncbi:MAG: hypothetical protein BGP12_06695 [Rhodospirillales bacterium 70-18]|nr:MAG: hypothetical protein BGP12_06695 [Rhodospirillales bacterium 70-18]